MVTSPLWTSRPEIMETYSFRPSDSLDAETVAAAMMEMVQSAEYPGGTVVKIDVGGKAKVAFEASQPETYSKLSLEEGKKLLDLSNSHVRETLAKERGVALR